MFVGGTLAVSSALTVPGGRGLLALSGPPVPWLGVGVCSRLLTPLFLEGFWFLSEQGALE